MQENKVLEILGYYLGILMMENVVKDEAFRVNFKRWRTFKDNDKIKKAFASEMKRYYDSVKLEKKVCGFLLTHFNKLSMDDIMRTFDVLDDDAKIKYLYIDSLINQLDVACDMELDSKFYVPRNKPKYVEDINKYLNVAKGFSLGGVKDFLIDERVYTDLSFKLAKESIKHLNVVGNDDKYVSGVFNKGIVLPEVKDDETALIAVHELVHNSLLMNRRVINDNSIVNGEELPIMYEYLYGDYNNFVSCYIHENEDAYKLYNSYEGEPFFVQIQKLKELKKIK